MDVSDILRVKYYSVNDLSVGSYLKRMEDVVSTFVVDEIRADSQVLNVV